MKGFSHLLIYFIFNATTHAVRSDIIYFMIYNFDQFKLKEQMT